MKDDDVASDNLSPCVRIFIMSLLNEANAGIADDVFKTVFDRSRTNNERNDRHRGKLIDSKKQLSLNDQQEEQARRAFTELW